MIKFGTAGFRAVIGDGFTRENVEKIAQALAETALNNNSKKPIIVGYDFRFMGEIFAKWFAEVLCGNGVKVILCNTAVPTPIVMFESKKMDNDYGIMISASHNPYEYNGIKVFISEGKDADVAFTTDLEKKINQITTINRLECAEAKKSGLLVEDNFDADYVDGICQFIDTKCTYDKKVCFNTMHGSSVYSAELFKRKLNLKHFDIVNKQRDAFFNFELPAPNEIPLKDFAKYIVDNGYEFGVATDGDGDRIGIIDEKGKFHSANPILAMLYYYNVKVKGLKGDIVKNLSTTVALDLLAEKFGFKCHETGVGFKYITEWMKRSNGLLGGEGSGGVMMRGYIYGKDGLFTAALLLEMQQKMNKPFSQIIKEVYDYVGYDLVYQEKNLSIKNKEKLIEALKHTTPKFSKNIIKTADYDGFKYFFEDGTWASIRFSGTEPVLRITAEQKNEAELNDIVNCANNFVQDVENNF